MSIVPGPTKASPSHNSRTSKKQVVDGGLLPLFPLYWLGIVIKIIEMYENQVSYKTKQQNLLKSKTQSFLNNYSQSFQRIKSRSSMHNLAGTVYSHKQNNQMVPRKSASKSVIFPTISDNPEMSSSQAFKGLYTRTAHMPNYSQINTELILERKNLQEKAAFLREEINREKKMNNRAEMNCKKLNNELERANNSIREMCFKSERLNEGIREARQDCYNLNNNLQELMRDNKETFTEINMEISNGNNLQLQCRTLKKNLLAEEKQRSDLKGKLIKEQKVMNSLSILTKQLEHERAVLLLSINKSVFLNKLT